MKNDALKTTGIPGLDKGTECIDASFERYRVFSAPVDAFAGEFALQYGRGQALEALGKADEAIAAYREAIRVIEQTRAAISEERYQAGYIEDRYQVYVTLVELLLGLGKLDDAFFYSEKLRARAYFDQLGANASVVTDSEVQQHLHDLAVQIRSLRQAIHKEYALPEKQRRSQALESYSAELSRAEKEFQELSDSSRGAARDSAAGTSRY